MAWAGSDVLLTVTILTVQCAQGSCFGEMAGVRGGGGGSARGAWGFGEDFGQQVDLTGRIREILVNYPPGGTILKEFIQNADDAGAQQIKFCLDERSFPVGSLADQKLGQFQDSSLLVYNDAVFSDEDFDSIQRIGQSSKQEHPTKT